MVNRDAHGRITKGSVLNPVGRSKRAKEVEYLNVLFSVCTPERWRTICDRAVTQAEHGDDKARKFVADYLIGTPVQKTEISGQDGNRIIFEVIRGKV